ncbi:MAG: nitrous oxide reductase accessory protein NosL [Chloroflexi bacterium]|nr:nitrous oxide reductase accessory protein NosL [Chloroflexota bacterium]
MNKAKAKSKKLKVGLYFLLFAFYFLLAACGPQSSEPRPPEIVYGREMCDACGMIISEPRFAAATLTTDGKTLKFDDAGEMFSYHTRHPEMNVRVWFVHDYNSQAWINGQTAFYVMSAEVKSPMGTGVAAFADQTGAQAFAGRLNAQVLTFDQVMTARPMTGKKM